MHQLVVVLVRAPDKVDARTEAEAVFKKLAEETDYDNFRVLSICKYDSEKGQSIVQTVFGQQTLDFNEHLAAIRSTIGVKPDEDLMEDHSFRFHCWRIGASRGSAVQVYDGDAEGVQDKAHLQNLIDDWPNLVTLGDHVKSRYPLWVVHADAHH